MSDDNAKHVEELERKIVDAAPSCAQCDAKLPTWPDAKRERPGLKVFWSEKMGRFIGACPVGHCNEWTEARLRIGLTQPQDITVRTLRRFVRQEDCTHGAVMKVELPAGTRFNTINGPLVGPGWTFFCFWCGLRWPQGEKPFRLIMP